MSSNRLEARRPRVLRVNLAGAGAAARVVASTSAWRGSTPAVDRVGLWSGAALAAAILFEEEMGNPGARPPLVVAVGDAVRRGVPTASRATIASRAPLTGLYADGQVGSDLGRRLAAVCDALVLAGGLEGGDFVLHVDAGGEFRLLETPELAQATPREVHARLLERLGPCATLSIGPAGRRRLPMASLVAGDEPPHFVGRGGLGAVLGELGLHAIAVSAAPIETASDDDLTGALLASPRLEGRADGGTLELFGAMRTRGELYAKGETEPVPETVARGIEAEVAAASKGKHGCKGCPTPCGWVFAGAETKARGGEGARFGATHALGVNLGLEHLDDALALLARCNELGVDAKEVGAALALIGTARERGLAEGPSLWGDREALAALLDELVSGTGGESGDGARLARGAVAYARDVGLQDELHAVRGAAVRPEHGLAALLGQCASARGSDPMRTFPFLAVDGAGGERLARLVAPMPLPAGAGEPTNPAGKGRLVWWHENLTVALDATGFCTFSAAALLVDATCTLDELAARVAPPGLAQGGAELLAAGEQVVRLQHHLNRKWAGTADLGLPAWARARLDVPGVWPEYRVLRGLDETGVLTEESVRRFEAGEAADGGALLPPESVTESKPQPRTETSVTKRPGRVHLRSSGVLAHALGAERELELDLPATVDEVLAAAAECASAAAAGADDAVPVLRGERAPPVVYRDGRRLNEGDRVANGDRLDLLLVISGGAR